MNKEKVFTWIESLEDMADQSDRYFVERTELYRQNQEKDKEIERQSKMLINRDKEFLKLNDEIDRLNNIINELEKTLKKLIEEQLNNYEKYPANWEERKGVSNTWLTSRDCYWSILNYLEKLKGENNE